MGVDSRGRTDVGMLPKMALSVTASIVAETGIYCLAWSCIVSLLRFLNFA